MSDMTQRGSLKKDDNGVAVGWAYKNITGQATTVVKASPGVLHTVTFNNPTATAVITLYDSPSTGANPIGAITVPASPLPVTLTYDVAFNNGLTIITGTADSNLTVSFI